MPRSIPRIASAFAGAAHSMATASPSGAACPGSHQPAAIFPVRETWARAKAWVGWRDQTAVGLGMATLDPEDRNLADISDELAIARALSDLVRRMMATTMHDIEA